MAEAEKMDEGDKDDTSEQIADYLDDNFSSLLRMQKRLKALKEFGPVQYTEDMAVADLASISSVSGSDKVQSSSISDIPQRVSVMLESGYVQKMQRRMNQEYQELCEELEYINWQLDIIDAAMEERMTEEQRVVFRWFYRDRMSLRYIHEVLMPGTRRVRISSMLQKARGALLIEVRSRKNLGDVEGYLRRLEKDTEVEEKRESVHERKDSRITNRTRDKTKARQT